MNTYKISSRSEQFNEFHVEANTYEEAAEKAIRNKSLKNTKKGRIVSVRLTGMYGYSGIFQAYSVMQDGTLNSTGFQFHVYERINK